LVERRRRIRRSALRRRVTGGILGRGGAPRGLRSGGAASSKRLAVAAVKHANRGGVAPPYGWGGLGRGAESARLAGVASRFPGRGLTARFGEVYSAPTHGCTTKGPGTRQGRVLHGAGRSRPATEAPRDPLRGLWRALLPPPCRLRAVPLAAHGRRGAGPAGFALQLHLRPLPALRLDAGRARRLRRRTGRPAGGSSRPAAARRQAGGLSHRDDARGRARADPRGRR